MSEQALLFSCEGSPLLAVLHDAESDNSIGVVIVVAGGPQYRVGAHRQFVTMARVLADGGHTTLRFDHRGTGDSGGECKGFIDMGADIRSAIDTLIEKVPHLEKVILWGECESASAIAFYASTDERVSGIFMVNPWIRTEGGRARTYLKHYYFSRLLEPDFWQKVKSGQFSIGQSFKSMLDLFRASRLNSSKENSQQEDLTQLELPERLAKSSARFNGRIFILTSGKDLIAQEFKDYVASSSEWSKMLAAHSLIMRDMPDADHTFSRTEWRAQLFDYTKDWIENKLV